MFFPASPAYKQMARGYDCFFDPERAFVDGHTDARAEYRFKADAQGLTPFAEIEGHTFVITTAMKENADKSVDRQNFLCFLEREDGVQLLLRIPFVRKPADNSLTRGMSLVLSEKNSFRKGPASCTINIPACPVSEFEAIKHSWDGKMFERNRSKDADETIMTLTRYLNGDMAETIYKSNTEMRCDSVAFTKVSGYAFMQPVAFCNIKGRKVQVPVYDFRGDGESFYGANFCISDYFKEKIVVAPVVVEKPVEVAKPAEPTAAELRAAEKARKAEEKARAAEEKARKIAEEKARKEEERARKAAEAEASPEAERLAKLTKQYGAKNAKLIMAGQVQVGFTKDMVREVMGEPDYINAIQNVYTTLEQWVYGHEKYLYFQKDKLKTIEDF